MSWFSNIITGVNTGIGVYNTVNSGSHHSGGACRAPSGCFQCQMTGQGDIAGCLDGLLVGGLGNIYSLLQPINGRNYIPNDQVLQVYQQALAAISNPSFFRQSDAYLIQAKGALAGYISDYQQRNGSNLNTTTVMVNANGQTVAVPSGGSAGGASNNASIVAGIPNTYLVGGAMAVLGLVYLLKK